MSAAEESADVKAQKLGEDREDHDDDQDSQDQQHNEGCAGIGKAVVEAWADQAITHLVVLDTDGEALSAAGQRLDVRAAARSEAPAVRPSHPTG